MTKGRVKLCLLCALLVTVCNVTGVCLAGDGGLPWTAADGKACFLSRDTVVRGSESFPGNDTCLTRASLGGKERRVCEWDNSEKTD